MNQLFITIIFKILSGGPLTITDANLCLGRLLPEYFPKIFGKNQKSPLDKAATDKAFKKLTREVRVLQGWNFGVEGGRGGELHGYHHITFLKDSFTYVRIISLIKMLSFIKLSIIIMILHILNQLVSL